MRTTLTLTLTLIMCLAALQAQAYKPQYKDTAGTTRKYEGTITVKSTMPAEGNAAPKTSTQKDTLTLTEKVVSVTDGIAMLNRKSVTKSTVEMKPEDLKAEPGVKVEIVGGGGMTMSVDEEIDLSRTALGVLKIADPPGGKVKDPAAEKEPAQPPFVRLDDIFLDSFGKSLFLQDQEVKKGDSWTATGTTRSEVPALFILLQLEQKYNITYTITGETQYKGRTLIIIQSKYSINSNNDKQADKVMGFDIVQTGTANLYFDEKAGELVAVSFAESNKTTMKVGDKSSAMEMTREGQIWLVI